MTHTPKHKDAMGMERQRDEGQLSGKSEEAFALLREIFPVEDRATYDGEPDDVERSQWVTNGARRRVAALLATTLTANPSGHSDKCWGRTSYSDEVMHCYCPERSATTQPAEQSASSPVEGEGRKAAVNLILDWLDEREIATVDGDEGLADAILAALTTRSVAVSSEAVARIIDPEAFRDEEHEAKIIAEGLPSNMDRTDPEVVESVAAIASDNVAFRQVARDRATATADKILSLLNQARKPEGADDAVGLSASELACYEYPGVDQAKERDAFVAGALAYAHPAHEAGEVERLRAALEPFARAAGKLDGLWDDNDWRWNDSVRSGVTVAHIRAARAALSDKAQGAQQ